MRSAAESHDASGGGVRILFCFSSSFERRLKKK
jgi:hypothetical protein